MGHDPIDCSGNCNPCQDYDNLADIYADQPSFAPEDLNQQFSFPYPRMDGAKRSAGNGCLGCVHQMYCPALYWFKRYTQEKPDAHNGLQCSSWSNNMADQIRVPTDFDLEENARNSCNGILTEPTRSGISTGGGKSN